MKGVRKLLTFDGRIIEKMATSAAAIKLRVTGFQHRGTMDYMEDFCSMAYQENRDVGGDHLWAVFGIYDGHGGTEAAEYTKENLIKTITESPKFGSTDDSQVESAIREGYTKVHQVMYKEKWQNWQPKSDGQRSTSGTTASICFVRRGKLFIANVGDSRIVLARKNPLEPTKWEAKPLTEDHWPDNEVELARIKSAGGKVVDSRGMSRVVWNKPTIDTNSGQTHYKEIPFLNMSRSLGDFWSYNAQSEEFIVSPNPDVHVYKLNMTTDRCIILASDGLWDNVSEELAVHTVNCVEKENAQPKSTWVNPSEKLGQLALEPGTTQRKVRDNISVITVILSQVSAHSADTTTNSGNSAKRPRLQDLVPTHVEIEMEKQWTIKI